jgi:undecaprenyl-diphosphatase
MRLASLGAMAAASPHDDVLAASDRVDDPSGSAVSPGRRRRWGIQAGLAAVTLGAIGGFLALTRTIAGEGGNDFDRAVVRAMGRARHPISDAVGRGVTFFGGVAGAASVSITALVLTRHRPLLAAQVAVGILGGVSAELGWKHLFLRRRPTLLAHLETVESSSFPSGHATAAASLYLTLAFVAARTRLPNHRVALLSSAAALATAVAVSRVHLGVHWPTDVLGGLALGTAWACAAEALFDLAGADRVGAGRVGAGVAGGEGAGVPISVPQLSRK